MSIGQKIIQSGEGGICFRAESSKHEQCRRAHFWVIIFECFDQRRNGYRTDQGKRLRGVGNVKCVSEGRTAESFFQPDGASEP